MAILVQSVVGIVSVFRVERDGVVGGLARLVQGSAINPKIPSKNDILPDDKPHANN